MGLNGSDATSGRWNFPDLWHTFSVTLPPNGETVQIIMVDTETLTGAPRIPPPDPPLCFCDPFLCFCVSHPIA